MNRLSYIAVLFAALLLVAADEKPEKAKEPAPSAAQIQLWIKQLGDESFKVREEATRDLIKAGRVALYAVTKATESEDAEVKQRALRIIRHPKKVAIAYFEKLGGKVRVDKKSPAKPVIRLDLRGTNVTDAGLLHLKQFTRLEYLDLDRTKVTDAGLLHLKGLTNLRVIYIFDTKTTQAGIEKLKKALPDCKISLKDDDPFAE